MCLDRCFGDTELIGNLLVEQTLAQHHKYTKLVRRQRAQRRGDFGFLRVQPVVLQIDASRCPYFAVKYRLYAVFECRNR